jgi:hypothetical protein
MPDAGFFAPKPVDPHPSPASARRHGSGIHLGGARRAGGELTGASSSSIVKQGLKPFCSVGRGVLRMIQS